MGEFGKNIDYLANIFLQTREGKLHLTPSHPLRSPSRQRLLASTKLEKAEEE
jgi:hypothetical protein